MLPVNRNTFAPNADLRAESGPVTPALERRLTPDTGSPQAAEAICALWADIELALHPVLGRRGVEALFERALHLTTARHPWLEPCEYAGSDAATCANRLASFLAAQQPEAVVEAGSVLLTTFHDVLATLIGARLSERLLQNVWSTSSNAKAAQDPIP